LSRQWSRFNHEAGKEAEAKKSSSIKRAHATLPSGCSHSTGQK
jgi:hypothetical protein